jgi:hypothetical protein
MKLDVLQPARVVNVGKLQRQFGGIAADASGLRLGALVRIAEAADHPAIRRDYSVLAQSLWKAASPQLGTVLIWAIIYLTNRLPGIDAAAPARVSPRLCLPALAP